MSPNCQRISPDRFVGPTLPSDGAGCSLGRSERLVQSALFAEAFAQRQKQVGSLMVLWLRQGEDACLRLGIVSSKKVHLRASKRNFARRRLREAYRRLRPWLCGGYDVILVARRGLLNADWKQVQLEMLQLSAQSGLISAGNAALIRSALKPESAVA